MVAACDTGAPANIGSNICCFPHSTVPITAGLQSSLYASQTSFQSTHQVAYSTSPDLLSSNLGDPISAIQLDRSALLLYLYKVSHIISSTSDNAQHSSGCEDASTTNAQFRIQEGSSAAPMVLDFSGAASSDANASSSQTPTVARRRRRPRALHTAATRQRSYAGTAGASVSQQHTQSGRVYAMDLDTSPIQGPIAPPQRQGAPNYKYFGRCDQLCQHCHAMFWLEEKRTGLPNRLSHFDPHERQTLREDIIEGLIPFLNDNNALVQLFRTARDKLREADIPNFQIRLFGVVGSNQYELPTADTIGAIVYEGGPESMTDYDVVIECHSREPESVEKKVII
ncbi:helitron helicase-like domain-containing protein [Artemisia annua]|uniref:Helitron helicase-like domain-containing protein n=1 Tax=Artemisia annua TaxID=35608 RepID=A0A2U1MUH5_ARTAN|nr:helitron helicase-like domain-containing protein [Artemisia annua]